MRSLLAVAALAVALALSSQSNAQVRAVTPEQGVGVRPQAEPTENLQTPSVPNDVVDPPPLIAALGPGGCSSSPFMPPDTEEEDTVFVADCGSGLDTGCTFRSGGPLIIQVPITRYIGETDGDGRLMYPYTLNANNMVSLYAKIRLPAYDVDYTGSSEDCSPERDRISINGKSLGFLTGSNNIWKLNEFTVPIQDLKFPSAPGGPGGTPAPAMNEIRIDIDTGNSDECWCTAIDWVSITIDAQAPIMLLHGVNSDASSWDGAPSGLTAFSAYLDSKMVIHSNNLDPISNDPAGRIISNGRAISGKIPGIAAQVGAKKVHMVCHSKGGLDTRAYLGWFYNKDQVEVLSQHTLSTPHNGSILATISIARITYNDPTSDNDFVLKYMRQDGLGSFLGQAPENPALGNLTIAYMTAFNAANALPGGIKYYAYGADADWNGDGEISNAEAEGMIPGALNFAIRTGTLLYQVLCCVEDITVTRMTNFFGLNEWHVINPVWSGFYHFNDMAVTRESAMHPRFTWKTLYDLNHSTIKTGVPAQDVLDQIKADFPVKRVPN